MRWLWRLLKRLYPDTNGTGRILEDAQRKREDAWKMRPTVEHQARRLANLPTDEFAARFNEAFGRRP